MFHVFDRRARTAPSHYPRLPFHLIRALQLVSSLVVGAIMSFFIWHLTHDHWKTPWTFIWLTSASLFSIAALACTIVLHCCVGLNPRFNLACNGFLLVLWALSWSLLTWYMSGTLRNLCDFEHWNEDAGVMVCRMYKALFSFTLFGFLSTIAAFALDIYVHRHQTRRGAYRLHDLDDEKQHRRRQQHRPEATHGPFTDPNPTAYAPNGFDAPPRDSEAWEVPSRVSMGPYGEQSAHHARQLGYGAVPGDQFDYDTGYPGHGGGGVEKP